MKGLYVVACFTRRHSTPRPTLVPNFWGPPDQHEGSPGVSGNLWNRLMLFHV